MNRNFSRLTALKKESLNLDLVEKQLEEVKPFLGDQRGSPGRIKDQSPLSFEDLRPDCPKGGIREAGITFRVPGLRQRG